MKVLIVYHSASLDASKAIFAALGKQNGLELRVLGPQRGWNPLRKIWQEMPEKDIESEYTLVPGKVFNAQNDFSGPYLTGLLREIKQFKPNIIHIFNDAYSLIHLQALIYRKLFLPAAKVCCLGVENIISKKPKKFYKKFLRMIIRAECDAVSCWSKSASDALLQSGFPAKKLKINYWGIPLHMFSPQRNTTIRNKLHIGDNFVIGFVGRLTEGKGLISVIEALQALPHEALFLCVGDGPFRQDFLAEGKRRGLEERIIWLNRVEDSKVASLMNAMDCLVLPSLTTQSWREQFGRVLPEAMACGLPVIGSDSGAIPEIIGDAGLVFSENDGIALAECVKKIMSDRELYSQLSIIGRTRVKHFFSVEAYAGQLRSLYQEVTL